MARKNSKGRKQWQPQNEDLLIEQGVPARKRPLFQNKRDWFVVLGIITILGLMGLMVSIPSW